MSRLKTHIKTVASLGLRITGAHSLIGALTGASRMPAVITYHRVVERCEESAATSIAPMLTSARMFKQHMEWIGRNYEIASLDEIGKLLETGTEPPRPTAAIAFDDGYSDVYHYAFPVLRKMGIPATVFVVTGLVGTEEIQIHDRLHLLLKSAFEGAKQTSSAVIKVLRNADVVTPRMDAIARMPPNAFSVMTELLAGAPQNQVRRINQVLEERFGIGRHEGLSSLTWEMLETMRSAGMTIGSHTRTHALLTNESMQTALDEAVRSRRDLEDRLLIKARHFAYPDGRHNADTAAAVAAAGYAFAYGTCRRQDPDHPLMTIPRKVLWEKSSVDPEGRFSPAIMACQMNWVFDLGSRCAHQHDRQPGGMSK